MRRWLVVFVPLVFSFCSIAFGQVQLVSPEEARRALENMPPEPKAAAKPARHAAMLPQEFAGWVAGPKQVFGPHNVGTLVGDDAPLFVEYGYAGAERREFRKAQQSIRLEAFRMKDSSGSYGLFTFYRDAGWETGAFGHVQFARHGNETLLRKEEVLVRAKARLSDTDLRQLAEQVGANGGGLLPSLPDHLPEKGLAPNTSKYILGPVAFGRLVKDFPQVLVDFDLGVEAELARYQMPGDHRVDFLLLSYPTPQIAAVKLKEWKQAPSPVSAARQIESRRVGPLLAFVIQPGDPARARQLLANVSYQAESTWNERVTKSDDAQSWARFLLNVFFLIGALFSFALITGLGFGCLRVLLQKRHPNRFFEGSEEGEIIRLNINYSIKRG
jgi:hypothetical protein